MQATTDSENIVRVPISRCTHRCLRLQKLIQDLQHVVSEQQEKIDNYDSLVAHLTAQLECSNNIHETRESNFEALMAEVDALQDRIAHLRARDEQLLRLIDQWEGDYPNSVLVGEANLIE
jgi:predicted  nucleic acid-binding Zn-ribbon protein